MTRGKEKCLRDYVGSIFILEEERPREKGQLDSKEMRY